jgi:hypothetical protein
VYLVQPSADEVAERPAMHEAAYEILGVGVRLRSVSRASIELIDHSFGVFRVDGSRGELLIELAEGASGTLTVSRPGRPTRRARTMPDATLHLMDELVHAVISGLHQRGLFAVHAAAVAHRGRALVLAGSSGAGKTTLAVALAAVGLEMLSDELAILDPVTGLVHPYRRRLHIRPGTPELVRGMEGIALREPRDLGGENAWAIGQEEAGATADGPRRIGAALLLAPRSEHNIQPRFTAIGSGEATLELMRGTWAASIDFPGALRAVGSCVAAIPCARLEAADPMATADAIVAWLERSDG